MDKDRDLEDRLRALHDDADEASPPSEPSPPRPLPNIDDEPPLRRLLGGRVRGNEGRIIETISGRLRSLKDMPIEDDGERSSAVTLEHKPSRAPSAELVFTAGPRAGERLPLNDRALALDRDACEAPDSGASRVVLSIWAQGARFMLRHNGVLVGGARPAMPVVTLDDGDELAWAEHRLRFRIDTPA